MRPGSVLKNSRGCAALFSPPMLSFSLKASTFTCKVSKWWRMEALRLRNQGVPSTWCAARRRVRYGDEDDGGEDYGHNEEIAMLELYSQSVTGEALIVHATVDEEEVEVLIFKGFSSSLSYGTSPNPTRSVLPARAVIKSIDRIKGPIDPSNMRYIQKGLTWEAFKTKLRAM